MILLTLLVAGGHPFLLLLVSMLSSGSCQVTRLTNKQVVALNECNPKA
jgi:hypothetical protein